MWKNYGGGGINDVKKLRRWRDYGCCRIMELVNYRDGSGKFMEVVQLWIGLQCLTAFSTICQSHRGGQFYW